MKKTPLKVKNINLKKTPLKKGNYEGLQTNNLLKKEIETIEDIEKYQLKKQNEKTKEKWEEIRQKTLERDNYKCVVCGKPATHVHHIHLRSKRKDLLFEINNLVSLCNIHHDHSSIDGLERVNYRIALVKHITVEELLKFAETKSEE